MGKYIFKKRKRNSNATLTKNYQTNKRHLLIHVILTFKRAITDHHTANTENIQK